MTVRIMPARPAPCSKRGRAAASPVLRALRRRRAARAGEPAHVLETEQKLWIIAALPGVPPRRVHATIEGDRGRRPAAVAGPECQYIVKA